MWGFYDKLRKLKGHLRTWNKDVFRNIFDALVAAENEVTRREKDFDASPSDQTRSEYHRSMAALRLAQSRTSLFWKQKANVKWLKGDANTHFYHQRVKNRRRRQAMRRIIREDGAECDLAYDINLEAIRFFQSLFSASTTSQHDSILQYITHLISADDNELQLSMPTLQEVKQAVWDLSLSSAAGPDGFLGSFYYRLWQDIYMDVLKEIQEFFLGIYPPHQELQRLLH